MTKKNCPVCGEPLESGALVCPVCGEMFPKGWTDSQQEDNLVRQVLRLALLADDDTVNLQKINTCLDCDICGQPMADRATLLDREILVYHIYCLEDKP